MQKLDAEFGSAIEENHKVIQRGLELRIVELAS
jgi:hypothetical protein